VLSRFAGPAATNAGHANYIEKSIVILSTIFYKLLKIWYNVDKFILAILIINPAFIALISRIKTRSATLSQEVTYEK